jgi:hypothetical protein
MMGRKLLKKDAADKGDLLPLPLLLTPCLLLLLNLGLLPQGMMRRKLLN